LARSVIAMDNSIVCEIFDEILKSALVVERVLERIGEDPHNLLSAYSSGAGVETKKRKKIDQHIYSYNVDYYSTTLTWQPKSRVSAFR
jgi:hypothetical protein